SSGTISIGSHEPGGPPRVVNDVAPKDRDVAMVFQNYALYPHMTVYDNMAFALKMRKTPKAEIAKAVNDAAAILGLESMLTRKPRELSGGQRQRVAVGRCIVRNPAVFLFDEPLSNLDAKLRTDMRVELNRLHQRLKVTMIYVTHDQIEAMTLGDRITIMDGGKILQVDEPLGLYERPVNTFVASFIGTPPMNLLMGHLENTGGRWLFAFENLRVPLPERWAEPLKAANAAPNLAVKLGIRPEDVLLCAASQAADEGVLPAALDLVEEMGDHRLMYFRLAGRPEALKVKAAKGSGVGSSTAGDRPTHVRFDPARMHLFDAKDGNAIAH
ncbi:MAG TPA: ATP-binding cassette domain-containing protein, partial [Planctomycetota bacterium]|nr:ATP-binding cassette domain-containing protein [Planctomycetota bacterium]